MSKRVLIWYAPIFVQDGSNMLGACFGGGHWPCKLGILITGDFHDQVAICRFLQRTENVHCKRLEWAAGWEELETWCLRFVCSFVGALASILYVFVYISGHVLPIFLASHGVIHFSLVRLSS